MPCTLSIKHYDSEITTINISHSVFYHSADSLKNSQTKNKIHSYFFYIHYEVPRKITMKKKEEGKCFKNGLIRFPGKL